MDHIDRKRVGAVSLHSATGKTSAPALLRSRPVNLYDWLLFLHVLAAFAIVGALVVFTVLLLTPEPAALRLTPLARRLWDLGGGGTIVFGVWLALNRPEYEIWDGWVIAALVLWVIAAGTGARFGMEYMTAEEDGRPPERSVALYAAMAAAVCLLLLDMIFKPGA